MHEKIKCEQVVKEFLDPLSKKTVKRPKKIKIFENFSRLERDLFNEAKHIELREINREITLGELNKVFNLFINFYFRINKYQKVFHLITKYLIILRNIMIRFYPKRKN